MPGTCSRVDDTGHAAALPGSGQSVDGCWWENTSSYWTDGLENDLETNQTLNPSKSASSGTGDGIYVLVSSRSLPAVRYLRFGGFS